MTKNKSTYSCTSCGSVSSKWMGQCPECLEWGTVIEESVSASKIDQPSTCILHNVNWNRILFDEAHHMRNKNSRFWGARKLISPIKWLISGTPIQNRRRDFFNLCSIIGLPASYSKNPDNMRELLNLYVLRRSKNQIGIKLPTILIDYNNVLWATEEERILSEDIHNAISFSQSIERLKLLIKARQICILPTMIKNSIQTLIDDSIIQENTDIHTILSRSSKLDAVIETLLSRKLNGNGKLIFCHFKEEIDTIAHRLKYHGITSIATFDGRTSLYKRSIILKEPVEFLILQIQTGCEGLNLQDNFNEVYFISPNWNPTVEEQAIARCHRIGQIKPVHVFRFQMTTYQRFDPKTDNLLVNHPSLDQYIHSIQNSKREICREIIQ